MRIFVNEMTSLWITIELWEAFTVDVLDKLIKASLKRLKLSCAMAVHLIFPGVIHSACGCWQAGISRFAVLRPFL